MDDLTSQQLRAINFLMRGLSKPKAMIRAGYSKYYAKNGMEEFWTNPKIAREVQKRRRAVARQAKMDATYLMNMLKAIIEMDVGKLVTEEGNLKNLQELDPDLRRALNITFVNGRPKISTEDRLKAIDLAAKLGGMYEENVKISGDKELVEALMAARQRAAARNKDDA